MMDILPTSVCSVSRATRMVDGVACVQLYCASCYEAAGIWVPERHIIDDKGRPLYLCDPCAVKCGPIYGKAMTSFDAYEAALARAQYAAKGRPFTVAELLESPMIAKMARERFTKDWSDEAG